MFKNLLEIIKNYKTCFLIAPSFPIDFKYPNIIGALKKAGADKITELTFGAKIVNEKYIEYIEKNPKQKYYIASPCPMIVSIIKSQYPELKQYLIPIVSPMVAQAKIVKKVYPEHKIIFVSPCKAKANIEAKEYKQLIDYVITFKELKQLFQKLNINENDFDECNERFDSLILSKTKVYPISGGLAHSAKMKNYFGDEKVYVTDGISNIKNILEEIKSGKSEFKFFDLLNCDGGCIGGHEINNNNKEKNLKAWTVLEYKELMESEDKQSEHHIEQHKKELENMDFGRIF